MGTWGPDSFENDDAADWFAQFCDDPGEQMISDALAKVTETSANDYLEAPECSVAIAAAEVIAALKGFPSPKLPDEARECLSGLEIKSDSDLVSSALKALRRVTTDSELKELWDEAENPDEWYAAVGNLEERLKQ